MDTVSIVVCEFSCCAHEVFFFSYYFLCWFHEMYQGYDSEVVCTLFSYLFLTVDLNVNSEVRGWFFFFFFYLIGILIIKWSQVVMISKKKKKFFNKMIIFLFIWKKRINEKIHNIVNLVHESTTVFYESISTIYCLNICTNEK